MAGVRNAAELASMKHRRKGVEDGPAKHRIATPKNARIVNLGRHGPLALFHVAVENKPDHVSVKTKIKKLLVSKFAMKMLAHVRKLGKSGLNALLLAAAENDPDSATVPLIKTPSKLIFATNNRVSLVNLGRPGPPALLPVAVENKPDHVSVKTKIKKLLISNFAMKMLAHVRNLGVSGVNALLLAAVGNSHDHVSVRTKMKNL